MQECWQGDAGGSTSSGGTTCTGSFTSSGGITCTGGFTSSAGNTCNARILLVPANLLIKLRFFMVFCVITNQKYRKKGKNKKNQQIFRRNK